MGQQNSLQKRCRTSFHFAYRSPGKPAGLYAENSSPCRSVWHQHNLHRNVIYVVYTIRDVAAAHPQQAICQASGTDQHPGMPHVLRCRESESFCMIVLYAGKEGVHTGLAVSPEHSKRRGTEAIVAEILQRPRACNRRHASLCEINCDFQHQL